MKAIRFLLLFMPIILFSCENDWVPDGNKGRVASFNSFSTNGQTILSTSIDNVSKKVRFEVDYNVDVTNLVPTFNVPDGYTVLVNGVKQESGKSAVDFTQPVTYIIEDMSLKTTSWQATAEKLQKKILIDASKDGGGWWFPQSPQTGFDQNKDHQGRAFAELLRSKGFKVDELPRGAVLKEEHFFGYYIIIRTSGFFPYTEKDMEIYSKLVRRGMNLVFFTDHKKYDPVDELGDLLGLQFSGIAYGNITRIKPHMITENLSSLEYIAGSVLTNAGQNPNIEILGWLSENEYADLNFNGTRDEGEPYAPPVMGILKYPKSSIFFIGDINGLEIMPQPFIDNLIRWMGVEGF